MGCFDCVCEKIDWYNERDEYCQLSKCSTFCNYEDDGWDYYRGKCCFYSSDREEFVDNILRINKHKGDDFDFSNLKMVEYDMLLDFDNLSPRSVFVPKKDIYLKDFYKLLEKQITWERDEKIFTNINLWDEKIDEIYFYDNKEVEIYLGCYEGIEIHNVTKADIEKFELLKALYFRNDKKKLKDILMYME